MSDDHLILRRNHVQPLGDVLADHMHGPGAARTGGRLRLDHHIHALQVRATRAASHDAATCDAPSARDRPFPLPARSRPGLDQVLEGKLQLVLVHRSRALAELQGPQLGDDVLVAHILRLEPRHLGFQARPIGLAIPSRSRSSAICSASASAAATSARAATSMARRVSTSSGRSAAASSIATNPSIFGRPRLAFSLIHNRFLLIEPPLDDAVAAGGPVSSPARPRAPPTAPRTASSPHR